MEEPKTKKELKIDIKGILKVVILLYAILILVGVLTYILPAGAFETTINESGKTVVIPGTFQYLETSTRIPWYRWLTLPIETLIFDSGKALMFQIIGMILLLGGCFKVIEVSGAMESMIKVQIKKFHKKRFLAIWAISFFIMILCSLFGIQEELLILFPVFLSFANAMNWDKKTALALVLITTSTGFTCALLNPLTVGLSSQIAGTSPVNGLWYRAIMLVILGVVTCIYLVNMAKKDEKKLEEQGISNLNIEYDVEITKEDKKKSTMVLCLFAFVLVVLILFSVVPTLQKLDITLIVIAAGFVVGTVVFGRIMIGSFKAWFKAFFKGVLALAPSIFVIVVAFSIKYLAEQANILHTIFNSTYNLFTSVSPYVGVIILLFFVLILEFFIPSASAKAALIIPLLTLTPIPGISTNIIILTYLLGDGYANVVYPTCGTLMIGLGVANVSYIDWIKKTGLFQLLLLGTSILFLLLAVAIGL